jgi:hypothetical protein
MAGFVWCKREQRRLPLHRCLLCPDECYPEELAEGEIQGELQHLLDSGKIKEYYVVKRKSGAAAKEEPAPQSSAQTESAEAAPESKPAAEQGQSRYFILEDGRLRPFSEQDYTTTMLYEVMESFDVIRRFVRPEENRNIVFEGKKPGKKTQPIVTDKEGGAELLESWEELESNPEKLAGAEEVLGVSPVKQVFVLTRK